VVLAAYGVARDFAETAWPRRTASPGPQSRKGLIQLRQVNYESNCNSARVDASGMDETGVLLIPKRFRIEFLARRREFITLLGGLSGSEPMRHKPKRERC
jgi:hypothetical protein